MELETHLREFTRRDWQRVEDAGPLRVATVGVGWWTRAEAVPAVEESDLCETTVLVSGSKEKAESATDLADSIDRGLTYEEFHDGVAADAYDAVYVVTPNARHLEFVETAASLGKAVLCEKPMEATAERARAMVSACDEGDVPLMIAYRMQTEPAVRRARELVREGAIGDPVQVHGHMSQPLLETIPNPDQWRLDPDLSGGATIMDLGLYPLNTSRFVLSEDPVAVQGVTISESEAFEDVPDEHASFVVEFPDSVTATLSASQNAAQSSHLHVVGTEGEVRVAPAFFNRQPRGFSLTIGGTTIDHDWEQVDQMTEEFDYFADRVLGDREPEPNGRHGLVDVETMMAIYDAAETGERIELESRLSSP